MAALVYLARPNRAQNRRLALMCALFGSGVGLLAGLRPLAEDQPTAYAFYATFLVAFYSAAPIYLLFLSTLDTPLARPLRRPLVKAASIAWFGGLAALVVVRPDLFIAGLERNTLFGHWAIHETRLYRYGLQGVSSIIFLYGLAVAVDLWRRASTPLTKRQAAAYALAFGVRDVLFLAVSVGGMLGISFATPLGGYLALVGLPVGEIFLAVLLAYGILSTQLFGIDLHLKWTLRRGTVAATFVGVFFVASEGAEQIFSARLGPAVGLFAAGALVFALAPLQRMADRVADAAMPGVKDTPEYRHSRRRDIYRNAVLSALADGVVTEGERTVLASLASDLGLTPRDALELEREAARQHGA
ncbi:MAG TPA: hypothetical protein VM582_00975 [Candidatus Thermoplasmatota archaeon]|nr:hypothetical protein [Candidatus Thermoplasmatota archaeon]